MLTDAAIRRLLPAASARRVFDGGDVPGFGVKVEASGAKSFFLRYSWAGQRHYLNLGKYPRLGVAAARVKARAALARLEQGIHPDQPEPAALGTLEALLVAWETHQRIAGRRSIDRSCGMIRRNCSHLLNRPAASITASDLRAVLAAAHQRRAPVLANRLRSYLHSLYRYGIQHDHDPRTLHQAVRFGLVANPLDAIPRDLGADHPGDRVLTWGEIREVWHTDRLTWPARQAVRLLLVFGCRVNEIVTAPWTEFDLDAGTWLLPAGRSKNKREHLLPLPPLGLELLVELRGVIGGDCPFPARNARGENTIRRKNYKFHGVARESARGDQLQGVIGGNWLFPARNARGAAKPWGETALAHAVRLAGYDWTPRDLRRTWKTRAGEVGIDRDARDRVQHHARQDVGSRHYDRYDYAAEKRVALETWGAALAARVAGENVVPLIARKI